jgi:2-iminobutanoate/2-iminopropanoate deaminase
LVQDSGPHRVITPANGPKPVGPYSPGIAAGDYLYVSGQGVRNPQNQMPQGVEAQATQCLENVKAILEAGGLSFADVVAMQLYVTDPKTVGRVNKVIKRYLKKNRPARVTLGVARMPTETPIEITVVARKGGAGGERIYFPAVYGKREKDVERKLDALLSAVTLTRNNLIYRHHYVLRSRRKGIVPAAWLPGGKRVEHGIFAAVARQKFPKVGYCEAQVSEGEGTIAAQTEDVFGKVRNCLASQGMELNDVVATNVYLDDMNQFAGMNAAYAQFFPNAKPTRTTVQPLPVSGTGPLLRIAVFAVK